ncbi:MAG: flagellar motor switch protein FliN, partial [Clostridia bacterium]|nr:flagellar motor switch protein FliN [Clostridia bacterium]
HRVDITTPKVTVENVQEFSLGEMDPAIGVEIKYITGLEGSNIMLLKLSDVRVIVDILMGTETPEEEFALNDLTLSAVCEVMNQMMGAASTALSDFLGRMVNISTPQTFDLDDLEQFKTNRLPVSDGAMVVVSFNLSIENTLQSKFINVMSIELARELVAGFGLESVDSQPAAAQTATSSDSGGGKLSQEEIEKLMQANNSGQSVAPIVPQSQPATAAGGGGKLSQEEIEKLMQANSAPAAPAPATGGGGMLSQEEIEKLMRANSAPAAPPVPNPAPDAALPYAAPQGAGYPYPPYYMMPPGAPGGWQMPPQAPPEPKVINTQAMQMPKLENNPELNIEQSQNLDLIMTVPLEVTVEIGRTKKRVQDILTFSKGSLVILDKLAGDQVDLFVNGKCIARGDVVVIDDNFGIRISEILRKPELDDITQQQQRG